MNSALTIPIGMKITTNCTSFNTDTSFVTLCNVRKGESSDFDLSAPIVALHYKTIREQDSPFREPPPQGYSPINLRYKLRHGL